MSTAILYIKTHIKQYKIESFWRMSNHLALKLALLHGVYSTKEKSFNAIGSFFWMGFTRTYLVPKENSTTCAKCVGENVESLPVKINKLVLEQMHSFFVWRL